jgi:hypothetical protein
MRKTCCCLWSLFVLLITSGIAFGQIEHQSAALVINGNAGKAPVIQENGRTYVDAEALAHIANGSLSFSANRIVLTIPPPADGASAAAEAPKAADDSALSREFMKAAIEEIALLREWGASVGYAVQNGYPIQEAWVNGYQEKAASGARLASAAASTTADKNAVQLLNNEFEGVRQWSNQLVEASKNMNTAKYSMDPGALRAEPLSQKLIACYRFLGSMLGSGSFQDDSSCH